jgi:hypothetical protein
MSFFPAGLNRDYILPDFMGGLYINNEDNLVVQIVKANIPNEEQRSRVLYDEVLEVRSNIIIEYVEYSNNELYEVHNAVLSYMLINGNASNIIAVFVDVTTNRVVVELAIYNEEEKKMFRSEVIDSELILLKKGELKITTRNPGGPLSFGCSVGYRARKATSGALSAGFVTAGHCVQRRWAIGWTISGYGILREQQFAQNLDAAWISTANLQLPQPTNAWHAYPPFNPPSGTLSTTVTIFPTTGTRVGRIGMTTRWQTGSITNQNWSGVVRHCFNPSCTDFLDRTLTRQVGTNVMNRGGDSGGIVYHMPNPTLQPNVRNTAGISVAGNNMIFTRADLINAAWGLSRY